AADHAAGVSVRLDEDGALRAAREGFDPHSARAGEEVEHDSVGNPRLHEIEDVLAHAVGRRPCRETLRGVDPVALAGAGDDPHRGILPSGHAWGQTRATCVRDEWLA